MLFMILGYFITFCINFIGSEYLDPELGASGIDIDGSDYYYEALSESYINGVHYGIISRKFYNNSEYFYSVSGVDKLAHYETGIVPVLFKIWNNLTYVEGKNHLILRYLRDFQQSVFPSKAKLPQELSKYLPPNYFSKRSKLSKAAQNISLHPLKVFTLLRRLFKNIPKILEKFHEFPELMEVTYLSPAISVQDLIGAADGILRMQEWFNISAIEIADGQLLDDPTYSGLTATDAQFLGRTALLNHQINLGLIWLSHAQRMYLDEDHSIDPEVIHNDISNAIYLFNSYLDDESYENDSFEHHITNDNDLDKFTSSGKLPVDNSRHLERRQLREVCRTAEAVNIQELPSRSNLKCWLKRDNPWLLIKPAKVEQLHETEKMYQFHDLLPPNMIETIKNVSESKLSAAAIMATKYDKHRSLSNIRVSNVAWIPDTLHDVVLRTTQIIQEVTEFNFHEWKAVENSQISCYGPVGGYYAQHYDTLYEKIRQSRELTDMEIFTGDRLATVMIYLSDVVGGGTAFPRLKVVVKPKKGSAVLWRNIDESGIGNNFMLHGGCPVIQGHKWILNKWIRAGAQVFHDDKCSSVQTR